MLGYHYCAHQPNLLTLITTIFKETRFHGIISLLAWQAISNGMNLDQHYRMTKGMNCLLTWIWHNWLSMKNRQKKNVLSTRIWVHHQTMGANAHSLVLVLEIKLVVDGELEILYESVYQGDEANVIVWYAKPRLGHYRWCMVHCYRFRLIINQNYSHTLSILFWGSCK